METQAINRSEAKRKLATVQKIKSINPIPNADAIEVVEVLGWKVVVKKDEVKVGQKVVYFEIDSLLPDVPQYEFLGKARVNPITVGTDAEEVGHPLKTAKLRGQISQGLVQTFESLPTDFSGLSRAAFLTLLENAPIGADVTKLLNVSKWDKPESVSALGTLVGGFPSHLTPKTDEERVQGQPVDLEKMKGEAYVGSEKLDGTSVTVTFDPETKEILFASRNYQLADDNKIRDFLEATGTLERIMNFTEGRLVLQSEFYGVGIQDNRVGIKGNRLSTFNIAVDGVRQSLLRSIEIAHELGLELPDIVRLGIPKEHELELLNAVKALNRDRKKVNLQVEDRITSGPKPLIMAKNSGHLFNATSDELVEDVSGEVYPSTNRAIEGIVYRPVFETDNFNPISFKVINNKFLIKHKL